MLKVIAVILCMFVASISFAKNEKSNNKQKTLPPGLEKKVERTGELPPGWEKKLVKGEILAPDLYEISKPISNNNKKYILEPQVGTEIVEIEKKFIRIKNDTKEILEIIGINTD